MANSFRQPETFASTYLLKSIFVIKLKRQNRQVFLVGFDCLFMVSGYDLPRELHS